LQTNPDICAGCDTCAGDWLVTDTRPDLPWTVYVTTLSIQGSGIANIKGSNTIVIG
jgi:hypothetical protein